MIKPDVEHIGIYGRTRSGKSTRARAVLSGRSRKFIFDVKHEHADLANDNVRSVPELVRAAGKRWNQNNFCIAYQVDKDRDIPEQLDEVSAALIKLQTPYEQGRDGRQITFFVEEMSVSFPNVIRSKSTFKNLCTMGSHSGVNLLGVAQRLADVSTVFRSQCLATYYFPLKGVNDVKAAVEDLGREHQAKLKSLKQHEYLYHSPEGEVKAGKNVLK